ncbi:MAG: serine hydrolase [Candidatus Marinimicrobia bacterium]|nr:serine hydrolase [Candidatus Neomarinimicrobiota bacterium]
MPSKIIKKVVFEKPKNRNKKMRYLLSNTIKIVALSALLFSVGFIQSSKERNNKALIFQEPVVEENLDTKEIKNIEILAKSACAFDLVKNEFIFEKNSTEQLPLASLTKLMTALVSKENLPESTLVEITPEAISIEGDSGFYAGEIWNLNDLINVMLISSSNDAAFAISKTFELNNKENESFVEVMNKYAKKLTLEKTHFLNPTGLDVSLEKSGAYGSCVDITKLLKYIFEKHPDLLKDTTLESVNYKNKIFLNTNKLVAKLPVIFGSKTGFSDLAGGNLTVIVDKGLNHPIILTVLGSTFEGRFEDMEILYNAFAR